jgi:hypothetical protein
MHGMGQGSSESAEQNKATLETEMEGCMAMVEQMQNQSNNLAATRTSNSNYVAWYIVS